LSYLSFQETRSGILDFERKYDLIRTYIASDDCGNFIEWEEVYNVTLSSNIFVFEDARVVTATKGVPFDVSYFVIVDSLCEIGYFVLDIGPATFVSSGPFPCFGA